MNIICSKWWAEQPAPPYHRTPIKRGFAIISYVKQFGMVQFCLPAVVILMKKAILAFERQTLSGLA